MKDFLEYLQLVFGISQNLAQLSQKRDTDDFDEIVLKNRLEELQYLTPQFEELLHNFINEIDGLRESYLTVKSKNNG